MLEYTFQHLEGYGNIKERELWKRKIYSWDDLERNSLSQLNFEFCDTESLVAESKRRLRAKDIKYFVERLPGHLHFLIPHSFPEDTVFVDIETTGLSLYYDTLTLVGWSKLDNYDVLITGDEHNKDKFLSDIAGASCIVTFNGSIFDIPFLKKHFPGIKLPPCHVDLRFFSKRVGYKGGQKEIERLLEVRRPLHLKEVDGFAATILWHEYKNGNLDSLKKLIEYNAFDLDGMKVILEKLTKSFLAKNDIPINKSYIFNFSAQSCKFSINDDLEQNNIYVAEYSGPIGPKITLKDLPQLSGVKIIGIDLTGSEKKPSGWALLEGGYVETKAISSDHELISETIKQSPAVISIDSPLSIPFGRTTVFDDDPMRDQYGITRECERTMAKRGVKSYPCLIPSMQRLTQRGMKLARTFRELGFSVIESYPGAAQDIMGIPRKQKGLNYLIEGLQAFGIYGELDRSDITHDEIDAVTSAIVGYFYLADQFEALGNEKEGYLIVPHIS